jgi:hypothetical protein
MAPHLYVLWVGRNYFLRLIEETLAIEALLWEHLFVVLTFTNDH